MSGEKGEIKQFDDSARLFGVSEHRLRDIEKDLDNGPHLLAVEFQRIAARSGAGLPVDRARIVTRHAVPVVLEIERVADP
jgi:hypothetical protein